MLKLNLISPDQKKQTANKYISSMAENILGIMVVLLMIGGSLMIPLKIKIEKLVQNNEAFREQTEREHNEQTDKFKNFNQNVKTLSSISNNGFSWSKFLDTLAAQVPEKISLLEMTSTLTDKQVNIKGYAQNRDDLIAFKDKLDASGLFEKTDLPLENYLSAKKINFEIQVQLK